MKQNDLFSGNNPLIKALGPILDAKTLARNLRLERELPRKWRSESALVRGIYTDSVFDDVVIPSPVYIQVYMAMISAMLRHYGRVDWTSPRQIRMAYGTEKMPTCAIDPNLVKPSASIVVVGPSGTGKTTMLNSLSRLWPTHIVHSDIVRGQTVTQIPVLYVQLTGRLRERSLYLRIIEAIDARIGGHELIDRVNYRRLSEPDLRSVAQRLCVQFNVGVIVIDEAQRLSGAASEAPDSAVNEMLYLRDGLGIPLVFCGTFTILKMLEHDERLFRRTCENGVYPLLFASSADDQHWELICEAYWRRLLLRKPGKLTSALRGSLFSLTAGMPWALKLLLQHSQKQALANGEESLTTLDLQRVYKSQMIAVHPMVEALRSGDPTAMQRYEHLYHPMFDQRERKKASREHEAMQKVLDLGEEEDQRAAA